MVSSAFEEVAKIWKVYKCDIDIVVRRGVSDGPLGRTRVEREPSLALDWGPEFACDARLSTSAALLSPLYHLAS